MSTTAGKDHCTLFLRLVKFDVRQVDRHQITMIKLMYYEADIPSIS